MSTLTNEALVGRMERLPLARIHKKIFALAAAGYLFDAYDVALLSFIMPQLSKDLGLTPVQIGLVISAGVLGMLFGALIGGTIADRFGRLRVFQYSLVLFAVSTGLTAFANNLETLLILRFITGLGLGGEQPVVFTFVSEMVPNKYRGRLNGMTEAMWGFGTLFAAGATFLVLPVFGWRWAFATGVLPALIIWFFRLGVPESPRWFIINGRPEKAQEELVKIEKAVEAEIGTLPKPLVVGNIVQQNGSFSVLFRPAYYKRTIMLWLLWFCAMFGYWGLTSWMPTLLKQIGYSIYASIGFVFIMNLVWVPSGFLGSYLSDKIGRKKPIIFYLICAGITTLLYGWAMQNRMPTEFLLTCGILVVLFMAGAFAVLFAYTPENYPTEVRGTGTGSANAMSRVGGFLAPTLVGYLYPTLGLYATLGIVAVGFVVGGIVVALLGEETKGQALESISSEATIST